MQMARPMTEDELLTGITEALTLSGWWWMHVRRSDQALIQGMQGFPDVFAIHADRGHTLAWELKSETGRPTIEQHAWLHAFRSMGDPAVTKVDARIVTPRHYDRALRAVLHGDMTSPWEA
jgi:hypothetical protein